MKYFKSLVLFAVLAIFPLGSWYYLQSGLDFRKNLLEELKDPGKSILEMNLPDSVYNELHKKTSLVFHDDNAIQKESLQKLKDQFADQYTFQMITIDDSFPTLKTNGFASLVDTSGVIRHVYTDPKDINKIVQHLALVIPRKPGRDIGEKVN